ncbi:MAG TPA: peptidoglycan DD-metalloendopeptidase family protein [Vicinamibacteria bacterium]|jgi:murein DD-endopeptidase MepM/ murein hydrolase activator NlpD|nr:peptidoglycan DD-metalloendopeptidase family protein [Vicinamibacteria bacterium]
MKRLCTAGALALLLLPTQLPWWIDGLGAAPIPAGALRVLRGTVGRRATLASLLDGTLSRAGVQRLVETARPVHDLARLSIGHPFGLALGPDGLIWAFTYGIDELRTLRVSRRGQALAAEVVSHEYETGVASVTGVIDSSLFAAVNAAGEDDQLALDLADIFAWEVDFNTDLRKGDGFRVAVEKLFLEGRFRRYGRLFAAELTRGNRVFRAVRFEGARGVGYYAPDGSSLRKAFLRSPLKFSRITSRFSLARFHPLLHETLPHLGVDYAAPTGTPVVATADGVVTRAGWDGGYGQAVRLRHANGFTTLYGHLVRIDVRTGQRVGQGTRIGAVGMTGLATGPHLDYRMTRNGAFVDPLRVVSPPAEPIPTEERAAFVATSARHLALLGSGAGPTLTATNP